VHVHDFGTEGPDGLAHPAAGFPRVQHPRREAGLAGQRPGGGRELDVGGEGPLEREDRVLGVGHAEDLDLVPRRTLQVGHVEHVRLGAAAAVQELVHVKNPHDTVLLGGPRARSSCVGTASEYDSA
jgi:hypothetical protein